MLRDLSIGELETRSRQEASKWLERLSLGRPPASPDEILAKHAPSLAHGDRALALLTEALPARFFPGASDTSAVRGAAAANHAQRDAVVESATNLLLGRFDLLGYRALEYDMPPDWHLDAVARRRAPLVHWTRIDPLDAETVGDAKVTWELNRHQWMVRLAQAHVLTDDDRYADACVTAIDSWIDANPRGIGINWTSSLELAYRLIAWSWTLALLRDAAAVSAEWTMKVLASIWAQAEHVRRYLSYYFSPNTHLTGEALGLFYAGVLFPEFREAAKWRDTGARILTEQSAVQILRDGVHFELSTCYHRYTIDIYTHFLLLAERNGIRVAPAIAPRLERMLDFLLAVRRPDGTIPQIGDDDGGTLLPLAVRRTDDASGQFAVAASVFERPRFRWAAEKHAPEVAWLMGGEGLAKLGRLIPARPDPPASRVFSAAGYAVMRSGWGADAHQLTFDAGPLGCPVTCGHGHADLLSIQCAIYGETCLVDPGTGVYAADSKWRDHFRSTSAHSTVRIDGRDQTDPAGPFRWRARPSARLRLWRSTSDLDFVDGEHHAYEGLAGRVKHRRRVFFIKPEYWIVVDDVTGEGTHDIEVRWQFAPVQLTVEWNGRARAETLGGNVLWVLPFASAFCKGQVVQSVVSEQYGHIESAPALIYSCGATLPWRMLTVLLPQRGASATPPSVSLMNDSQNLPAGITFGDDTHVRNRWNLTT